MLSGFPPSLDGPSMAPLFTLENNNCMVFCMMLTNSIKQQTLSVFTKKKLNKSTILHEVIPHTHRWTLTVYEADKQEQEMKKKLCI